ncbi:MAG: hypothetical protein LC101_11090 [Flavobacteriales bacterium]|nr:hypothetical protein [Flavobacteriales bacterium]
MSASKGTIRKNIIALAICMVLSGILWLLTTMNQMQTNTVAIPLQITGIPTNMVSLHPLPTSLNLRIQATGYRLLLRQIQNSWMQNQLTIDLASEFSDTRRSVLLIPLQKKIYELGRQIGNEYKILSISPDTLYLQFDIKTTRKVKVFAPLQLGFAQGYAMRNSIEIKPDFIELIGNPSAIEGIDSISTETITNQNVSEDIQKKVAVIFPDGISSDITMVDILIPVGRMIERKFICTIQIQNNIKNDIHLLQQTVEITARVPDNKFHTLRSSDFTCIVDAIDVNNQSALLIVKPKHIPIGCSVLDIQPPAVEYLIKIP